MFSVREIPVVIEPGVAVLESSLVVDDSKAGERVVSAHFWRVNFDEEVTQKLPLVPTTQLPHVFTLHEDVDSSPLLLVYDLLGRLTLIYVREHKSGWERRDVSAEHAGKTVTQFSVRFCFNTLKERNKFLTLMNKMADNARDGAPLPKAEMTEAATLLGRSRVAPVVLPVAVAKSRLKNVRI